LGLAGFVFALGASSAWAGIVATINARRLGRGPVAWRGAAIGLAALVGCYLSYCFATPAPWWTPPYARVWMGWKFGLLASPAWWLGPGLELFAWGLIFGLEFWPRRAWYRDWLATTGRRPSGLATPLAAGFACAVLSIALASAGQEHARRSVADGEYYRGLELVSQGAIPAALEAFSRVIAVAPDNADALRQRGRLLSRLTRHEEALADLRQAAALRPQDAELLIDCAQTQMVLADYKAAAATLDKALAVDPQSTTGHFIRGVARSELGQYEAALQDIDAALAVGAATDADRPLIHAYRGKLQLKLDRPAAAVADFTSALERQPDNAVYLFDRGLANLQQRKLDDALGDFSAAIKRRPDGIEFYLARANVLLALDKPRDAVADCDHVAAALERLAAGSPESAAETAGVYSLRARCRVALGDLTAASADAAQAIALDPAWADGYFARGLVAMAHGDRTAANADFDRALDHAAKDARVYARALYARGENRIALGDAAMGQHDRDEALRLDPDAAKLHSP